jgi:nicotinate-nucleotide adenylyltransferase
MQPQKQKIGIMGGTFNPIHNGHLFIADQVQHQLGLEKIYFMPDYIPPHVDHKSAISAEHRVKMVQMAIANNTNFRLETIEIDRKGTSYTYDTICELKQLHPQAEFYFIIGGDMVAYLPKWYRINELLKLVQFVGVQRANYPIISPYPVIWVDITRLDISSTLIRNLVQSQRSIRYLVPETVFQYIKEHQLYESN